MSTTARNLTIKNVGSTAIPPRGAVEVTTATRQTDGTLVYSVRRPTDPIGGTILFNHRSPVEVTQWGSASDRPVEQGLTTGVAGDEVGPVGGSYELQPTAETKTHRVVAVLTAQDKLASLERLGGGGGGGPTTIPCRPPIKGHNLSGREARQHEALYLERDDRGLAATRGFYEDYYPSGGATPVLIEHGADPGVDGQSPLVTSFAAVSIAAAIQPDDLVLAYVNSNEVNYLFPGAASNRRNRYLPSDPFATQLNAGGGGWRAIWASDLGSGQVIRSAYSGAQFRSRRYQYLVVRGVEKFGEGTNLIVAARAYSSSYNASAKRWTRNDGLWLAWMEAQRGSYQGVHPNPYYSAPSPHVTLRDSRWQWNWSGNFRDYLQWLLTRVPNDHTPTNSEWSSPNVYSFSGQSFYFLGGAADPPALPTDTCSLRVTGLPYSEPVRGKATDAVKVSDAQRKLRRAWRRKIVIAAETIPACGTGKVIAQGQCLAWVYVRRPDDQRAGPPPINRWRTEAIDFQGQNPGGPIEAFTGPYYERGDNARVRIGGTVANPEYDPLLAYFTGHPWCLYSGNRGAKILHRYRADSPPRSVSGETETVLTITATFTRTAGVVTITAVSVSATSGGQTVTGIDGGVIATDGLSASGDVSNPITIARDPLEFDDVSPTNGAQNRGSFSLACGRWTVRPLASLTAAMTDGQSLTDTFAFSEELVDLTAFPAYAPFVYETPQTAPAGIDPADLAPWPQYPREPSDLGVQPYGLDGLPIETHTVRAPAGFDPLLGRVPGSVAGTAQVLDRQTGLQLCLIDLNDQTFADDECC